MIWYRVARATRPFRSATRRPEWQAVTYFSKTYDWPRAVSSRSERRVAARDRRVACATPGKGGTGNLPVPLGHWPDGTERSLNMEIAVRESPKVPLRSERRVAARDRRVACATLRGGGRRF